MGIERVITSTGEFDNNVWLVGDGQTVLVIDASHDADAIVKAVRDREVTGIYITHAHNDHINVAPDLSDRLNVPVYLHPDDQPLWRQTHPDRPPDRDLKDGQIIKLGKVAIQAIHTPGHTPGSTCFYFPDEKSVFTGDTLFPGGPGATRGPFANFDTIIKSIKSKLFTIPPETKVLPGHGDSTSIETELPHLDEWIKRGW